MDWQGLMGKSATALSLRRTLKMFVSTRELVFCVPDITRCHGSETLLGVWITGTRCHVLHMAFGHGSCSVIVVTFRHCLAAEYFSLSDNFSPSKLATGGICSMCQHNNSVVFVCNRATNVDGS